MIWFSSCRSLGYGFRSCGFLGCGLLTLTNANASLTATERMMSFIIDHILRHHTVHVVDYKLIHSIEETALNVIGTSAQTGRVYEPTFVLSVIQYFCGAAQLQHIPLSPRLHKNVKH